MRKSITDYFLILALIIIAGCVGDKSADRVDELHSLPVLWESEILVANPNIPQMKTLIPLYDRYDANLLEVYTDSAEKTEDYIPESVRAYALERYENKPREVTLKIGDTVSVIAEGKLKSGKTVFLVRTTHETYAWLYAHHLQDADGNRISRL